MASPLIGAWKPVDISQGDALWVFSESHYCGLFNAKGRKRVPDENPSEAEEAEAYRSMRARAGTYTLSGSNLTLDLKQVNT